MDFIITDTLVLRKDDIKSIITCKTVSSSFAHGVTTSYDIEIKYSKSATTCPFDTKEERDKVFNDIKQQLRSDTDGDS